MPSLGRHILVDLYECSSGRLDDEEYIAEAMAEAARRAGATVIDSTFHRFSPCGVSGVLAIRESHLAIHTWPEYGYAAVDIFTCGPEINPWRAYDALKEALGASHGSAVEIHRGLSDLLGKSRRQEPAESGSAAPHPPSGDEASSDRK